MAASTWLALARSVPMSSVVAMKIGAVGTAAFRLYHLGSLTNAADSAFFALALYSIASSRTFAA